MGATANLIAWTPVFCRVARGVVNFPDAMPNAVWLATLGLFGMFFLFVMAEASVVVSRVRSITRVASVGTNDSTSDFSFYLIAGLSQRSWKVLAFTGGMFMLVLVSAGLLSIPQIREKFVENKIEQRSRAEPWFLMVFILILACSATGGTMAIRWYHCDLKCLGPWRCAVVSLTGASVFGTFAVAWSFVASTTRDSDETAWQVGAAVALVALVMLWGVNAYVTVKRLRIVDVGHVPSHETEPLDPTVSPLRHSRKLDKFELNTLDSSPLQDEVGLGWLPTGHLVAGILHGVLVMATVVTVVSLVEDNLFVSKGVPLVVSDWLAKTQGADDHIELPLCAAGRPLPVYTVLCSIAWSTCSCIQHTMSWLTLVYGKQSTFAIPRICRRVLSLLPGIGVVWYVSASGILRTLPATWETNDIFHRLQLLRTYRWIEYSLSATLMFVVVLSMADISTAHEMVLSASLFAFSMLAINPSSMALDDAELLSGSRPSVAEIAEREKNFLFLSFFAKTLLSVLLVVPAAFAGRSVWKVILPACLTDVVR